jgi:hypothetical protein
MVSQVEAGVRSSTCPSNGETIVHVSYGIAVGTTNMAQTSKGLRVFSEHSVNIQWTFS